MASPSTFSSPRAGRGVSAILGPTNTGKTHLAIERMVAHETGMIGLPLRLLAREVYSRVVEKVGADNVALITGEEKILPSEARFSVCTVEAMPTDLKPDFLAVDEIQLASDLDRGHVFTDRLLNARGSLETLLLGSQTIRPLVEHLLPGVNIITRPRLSQLSYAGDKKITRLPRRSAVVSFSAGEVYTIAELIRRHRGGAAVVMGALSPRTRNAQVALYQAGEVDFLVATDAIGMGLNLDVEHVAFASDRKYDGFQYRRLTPSEFGQVAGRAGRFTTDGTFGVTARVEPFDAELVDRVENHEFPRIEVLQWRNADLEFSSAEALLNALDEAPSIPGLVRAPLREDRVALEAALRAEHVKGHAGSVEGLKRLWDVCAIPDYRKIAPANHAELVIDIFDRIMTHGAIPDDWIAQQVGYADRVDGDIDTLSNRVAHIRTWTFVANRPDWVRDPAYWRETTRQVEDRLSDALHERLLQRFVDRRTSVLMKRMQETETLAAKVDTDGLLHVEDHHVGRIEGLTFHPEATTDSAHEKAIRSAAQRVLAVTLKERAQNLVLSPDQSFSLGTDGKVLWGKAPVGRLERSDDLLKPRVVLIADDQLSGAPRESAEARLQGFLATHAKSLIQPLLDLREAENLDGVARGIAFRMAEGLGAISRNDVADEVNQMEQPVRQTLRALGVRFGAYHLFIPLLLKPGPRSLLAQYHAIASGTPQEKLANVLHLSASGRTSVPRDADLPDELYHAVGYRVCGAMAVRIDILERLADLIRPLIAWKPSDDADKPVPDGAAPGNAFTATVEMTSLVGCAGEDFASILKSLGYKSETVPAPTPEPQPVPEPQPQAETALETAPTPEVGATASSPEEPVEPNQAPAPEASSAFEGVDESEGETEPATITLWRPKPFKKQKTWQKKPQGDQRQHTRGPRKGGKPKSGGAPHGNPNKKGQRPQKRSTPRPERGPDPNSPFAALAALKDKMGDTPKD